VKVNYLKLFLYLATALIVAGCGGSSHSSNTISVSITGAPSTVTVGTTATLGVTVTNDAANAGVTWGVTGGGTFTSTTTSLVYAAPATVPSPATVTVTATSITDTTKSNSVTFTIVAAPAITVTITGAPSSVSVGTTATLGVTVTNDSANAGVTWAVNGGGTFTSTTTSLVYTAPATVPASATVTVTATSISDTTKSNSVTFTIVSASALTVHITNPLSTVPAGSAAVTINATVTNDGSTPGVTWTLVTLNTNNDCQPVCGTLSGATTTSVVYTPPSNVPAQPKATIFAKSNSDSTKYGENTFTITGSSDTAACTTPGNLGEESALTLPYAFILKGQDAGGGDEPLDYVGSFTPDGSGGISHADLDINGFSVGSIPTSIDLDNSSYSYGSDGRGCLFLSFAEVSPTVKKVKTSAFRARAKHSRRFTAQRKPRTAVVAEEQIVFAFALLNTNSGRIQEFDNLTGDGFFAAGQMHVQTTSGFSTDLSPNFAFGVDGWVSDVDGGIDRSAIAGSFANSSGTLSNLTADENFAGDISGEQSGGSGTLDTPSSTTGRGTGTLTVNTDEGTLEFDFVYYVVNEADVYIMSSDDPNTGAGVLFGGRALSTGTTGSSPNGNFIYAMTGLDCTSCGTDEGNNVAQLATLGVAAEGAARATVYLNDAGTFTTNSYTGTFTVEQATKRGTVTNVTATPPVAYFTNTAEEDDVVAFLVGTDAFGSSGFVLTQTGSTPNFSASSVSGNYAEGTAEDISGLNGSETGVWSFDGVSAYTNILDLVQPGGTSATPFMLSGNYTLSASGDGSGTYSGTGGTTVAFVTNGDVILSTEESSIQPQLHVFIRRAQPI
jgi:hypothetical protein